MGLAPRPRNADSARVRALLERLRARDFSYQEGQILGSMCTQPHPLAVEAHNLFLTANLGDPGHFPGAREIEERYLTKLLQLAGANRDAAGQATSGGSEANILALALMREKTGRKEVIVPRTGHFSLEKAAKFMGLRLRVAETDEHYRAIPGSIERLVGPRTAGIVAIAGSTQVGSIDPIREVAAIAQDHDVPLHVDAAFGGYILPFLPTPRAFGFDVSGVTSLTMDSHKMGMGTLGAGALLVRDPSDLDTLSVETPYLSVPRQRGVLGTRSGAPVAAAWALLESLGAAGYRDAVRRCMETTRRLVQGLEGGGVLPLIQPELNIVAVPAQDPVRVQDGLSRIGWRVNVLPRLRALRIVCMPHVTDAVVDRFLPPLLKALDRTGGGSAGRRAIAA